MIFDLPESVRRRSRLALLSLYACLALISSIASLAATPAAATPYQATATAQCPNGKNCILSFPAVPAANLLEVRYVGCEIVDQQGFGADSVRIYLQTTQNRKPIALDLQIPNATLQEDTSGNFYSTNSQPVSFYVPSQQTLNLVAWSNGGLGIDRLNCTVNGELVDTGSIASYETTAHAQCPSGNNCLITFPKLPAGKSFEVQYAACEIRAQQSATTQQMRFLLQTKQGGKPMALDLATLEAGRQDDGAGTTYSTVGQPVEFSVPSGQKLSIAGWPGQSAAIDRMDCTAVGIMHDASDPAPYQATAFADCSTSTNCIVAFPAVPQGQQLEVQFAACELTSASSGSTTVADTRIYLQTQQHGKPISLNLTEIQPYFENDGTNLISAVSQPVGFSVPEQQVLDVVAWPYFTESIDRMSCTIYGQLQ